MDPIAVSTIFKQIGASDHSVPREDMIMAISIDSRAILRPKDTLFIAMSGAMTSGHTYLKDCLNKGVQNFIITDENYLGQLKGCNVALVDDAVLALQQIATHYRSLYKTNVIGITGSNGKTTVKEWLSYLLSKKYKVAKSPASYNSQIGVPLSVLEMDVKDEIGVFEAGISRVDEMHKLQPIINPTIGIFTNIGTAHNGGFPDKKHKIEEKLKLFSNVEKLILCEEHKLIKTCALTYVGGEKIVSWGFSPEASIFRIVKLDRGANKTQVVIDIGNVEYRFYLNVADDGSIENVFHCLACLLELDFNPKEAIELIQEVFPIPMRLEIMEGANNNTIINDAYNHDLSALRNAVELLHRQGQDKRKIVVLSDVEEAKISREEMEVELRDILLSSGAIEIWWLGDQALAITTNVFSDKDTLKRNLESSEISNAHILIKGARKHKFEELKSVFLPQRHSSVLKIDLKAVDHNLQVYASRLSSDTGIIAVVKAGAYGSGSVALARLLEYRGINYLAVAFADEGVALRKAGIMMPIMVLNPSIDSLDLLTKYQLEPEVYSLSFLDAVIHHFTSGDKRIPIHIKLDTGMHRLGFGEQDLDQLCQKIEDNSIEIGTIFSHLAGSETADEDDYTAEQHRFFNQYYDVICNKLGIKPKRHFVNTGGIIRFPQYHYDYVRFGLGMFGIDMTREVQHLLEKVHTFSARIIQTKWVEKGSKIGYNQKGEALRKSRLGIINVGYADGLPRLSGNGTFRVLVNDQLAPILGNVCMDLTIIDLTDCPVAIEGDEVEIFGPNHPIEHLSKVCQTIPYEILSQISPRVRREWTM